MGIGMNGRITPQEAEDFMDDNQPHPLDPRLAGTPRDPDGTVAGLAEAERRARVAEGFRQHADADAADLRALYHRTLERAQRAEREAADWKATAERVLGMLAREKQARGNVARAFETYRRHAEARVDALALEAENARLDCEGYALMCEASDAGAEDSAYRVGTRYVADADLAARVRARRQVGRRA